MARPADFRALALQIDRLLRTHRVQEAQQVLVHGPLSPQSADYHLLDCAILRAGGDDAQTLRAVRRCRATFPSEWRFVELELSVRLSSGDAAAVDACLDDLHASSAPALIAIDRQAHVLILREAYSQAAQLLEDALADGRTVLSDGIAIHLMGCHFRLGRYADCLAWLERALAVNRDLHFHSAQVVGAGSCSHPDDYGEAWLIALRERYPGNAALFEAHCSLLLMKGRIAELEKLLSRRTIPGGPARRKLHRIAAAAGLERLFPEEQASVVQAVDRRCLRLERHYPPRRAIVECFPAARHWVHARGASPTGTIVAFTGGNGHFGISLREFDHHVAALGLDAVYFRDPARQYYFRGIEGVGSSMAEIAGLLEGLQMPGPIHCLSSSAGSFAALGYGLQARVDGMLLFGPLTCVPERFDDIPFYDHEWRILHRYVRREYPGATFDYPAVYLANPPRFPIHMYYGENDPEGTFHVERMSGVPNVRPHVVPGSGHPVVNVLDKRNALMAALALHLLPTAKPA